MSDSARPVKKPKPVSLGRMVLAITLLALAGFGLLCAGTTTLVFAASDPQLFGLALALATVCTVPYTLALLWIDRNEKEPTSLLLAAFLWGALAATSIAGLGNNLVDMVITGLSGSADIGTFITASFAAPLFEETAKAAALLGLFVLARYEFDNVLDGIVYGAVIGLGFAWFENIQYYMEVSEEGPVAMMALAWARGVVSGIGSHATFTGIAGLGFGLFRVMRKGYVRWLAPPTALAMAMFAHFAWNTFCGLFIQAPMDSPETMLVSMPLAVVVLQLPFILLLAVVVVLVLRHEDDLIVRYLRSEADDIIHDDDLVYLVPARARLRRSTGLLFRSGVRAWWRHRALSLTLVELAFARWHQAHDVVSDASEGNEQLTRLRHQVRSLRAAGTQL